MEELRHQLTWLHLTLLFSYTSLITCTNAPVITRRVDVEYNLRAGENLHIRCPIHSQPAPIYQWLKNGKAISSAWDSIKIREDLLIIKSVEKIDSGDYVCEASNGFGTNKVEFSVCVQGNDSSTEDDTNHCTLAPSFLQDPGSSQQSLDLGVGDSAHLSCTSRGKPRPEVRWIKDGNNLSNRNADRFIFVLQQATRQEGGQYICHVYNSAGSVNRTFTITVRDAPKQNERDERPWFFPSVMNNITRNIGETARFSCQIYSRDERTLIRWFKRSLHSIGSYNISALKESDHIQAGISLSRVSDTFTSTLTIEPVTSSSVGTYVCVAFNGNGIQAQEATLKISSDLFHPNGDRPSVESTPQYLPVIVVVGSVTGIVILALVIWLISRRCAAASSSKRTPSSTASTTSSPHNSAGASSATKSNLSGAGPRPYLGYGPVPSATEHPALMQGYMQPHMVPQPPMPYPLHQQHLIQQQQQKLLQQPTAQGDVVQFQYYEQC